MENSVQKNAWSFTEGGNDDDDDDDDDDIIIVYFSKHVPNNSATKENECLKDKDNPAANSTALLCTRLRRLEWLCFLE